METENIVQKIESAVGAVKRPGLVARFLSAISYLGILCLAPIILKAKNDYVRFHARQGLVLFIAEIIFTLIWIIPLVGWVIGFIGWLLCFVLAIIGLIRTIAGREWIIPLLGKIAKKIRI
ncbi:hypothetical protein ISS21_01045 [Patescibacteria group bacterium]|nr:hypothetical protein [Patescibacteria group bacterium]